jgi:hypothetical protein
MVSLVALFVTLLVILFVLLFVFIWLRIEVTRLSSAEAIAGVVVQLGKAKDEILARIAGLEAAAAAGGGRLACRQDTVPCSMLGMTTRACCA